RQRALWRRRARRAHRAGLRDGAPERDGAVVHGARRRTRGRLGRRWRRGGHRGRDRGLTRSAHFFTTAVMQLSVVPLDHLTIAFRPRPWPFAEERRAEIDAHFAACRVRRPQIWNRRVLLARAIPIAHPSPT